MTRSTNASQPSGPVEPSRWAVLGSGQPLEARDEPTSQTTSSRAADKEDPTMIATAPCRGGADYPRAQLAPDRVDSMAWDPAAVRALVPSIRAAADDIEAKRCLPPALVRALADAGLFRIFMPRSLGGAEVDPLTRMEVLGTCRGRCLGLMVCRDRLRHRLHVEWLAAAGHGARDPVCRRAYRRGRCGGRPRWSRHRGGRGLPRDWPVELG
jgi:hypothetical protein